MSDMDTHAQHGVVAAGPPDAPAEAGVRLLRAGGNAVDAAVAAALVESVVNPNVSGIGGSGAMTVYLAAERRCVAIDYNTQAPRATHERVFEPVLDSLTPDRWRRLRDAGWHAGRLVTVPGCVAGLEHAVRRYGRRSWPEVAAPAVEAISGGLLVHERLANELPGLIARYETDAARRMLTVDGRAPRLGERLTLEPFVDLVRSIATHGADAFYRGEAARRLARSVGEHGDSLTEDDLAGYEAREVEPVHTTYRGYDLYTMPPALGGASVLEFLNVLEGYEPGRFTPGTPEWADLFVRIYRLVWRDRLDRLGDGADVAELLSKDYAVELRTRVAHAAPAVPPDGWRGGPGTIHISAADAEGNLVALTQSLIGGSHFVPELGLLINQSLVMFDPRPGHPNAPGPGKRPLVNMAPTIVLENGRPRFALGAPGARHIVSALTQMIVNLTDFGMTPADALGAPRVHAEADGPVLVETCMPAHVSDGLRAGGHEVEPIDRIGGLGHVAGFEADGRTLIGATDPRASRSQWADRIGVVKRR